ncbi:MAG: RluA family pseudouridine synthase [Oscillospiraceae bacterium]|nr:RluA family pseudouridine synthase [Oscillospiraceae bacterium]
MKEYIINKNDSDQRVDKFLEKAVKNLPKSLLYKYIRTKRIKLNGKRCEISTRLSEGDILQLYINDEFFETKSVSHEFLSVPSKIDIVYEDENILLVNKKCGEVVHEDDENTVDTLINRIKHYLYEKGEYNPDNENSFAPSLCNRLDRNTEGIVISAKNAEALRILNQKIKDRELKKEYLCVTISPPPKNSDTAKAYLKKDEAKNKVFISDKKTPDNKTIITKYEVLKRKGNLCLLNVDLITGRTHQIRAHLAHLGAPLLGDGKYGINKVNREYSVKTQALCSYKLTFDFTTESGILSYLDKKTFEIKNIWFVNKLF